MFQHGVDAMSRIVDAFLSKSSKFYLVRIIRKFSNFARVAQTLLNDLQMTFQTYDTSICNDNMKYPIETSTFHS